MQGPVRVGERYLGDAGLFPDGLDRVRRGAFRGQLVLVPALGARLQLGGVHRPPVTAYGIASRVSSGALSEHRLAAA